MKRLLSYFSKLELTLWGLSVFLIITSFLVFDGKNFPTLVASLIGVTSLIFNAKGNPFGQALMILFSIIYGMISFGAAYYGEMITYMGMTLPMSVFAFVSWIRHPYKGQRTEVSVREVKRRDVVIMAVASVAVTVTFYYILKYFDTADIVVSTASVTTSFVAVYLTFLRSPLFALAYAMNDMVLILLWAAASAVNTLYIPVVVCFAAFLVNDIYGFVSWQRMKRRQSGK